MKREALVLSIKPQYACKIFSGEKLIELRKIRPSLQDGDKVFVYVSSPVMKMMGLFVVSDVISDSPYKLWKKVGSLSGISKNEFNNYYDGSKIGYGIKIKNVSLFRSPISLTNLKSLLPGFRPPQCYRYLDSNEFATINSSFQN